MGRFRDGVGVGHLFIYNKEKRYIDSMPKMEIRIGVSYIRHFMRSVRMMYIILLHFITFWQFIQGVSLLGLGWL